MEGCKVTFKNGTLMTNFANCKMFIQNYSDLVLEDVTVDISKGEGVRNGPAPRPASRS